MEWYKDFPHVGYNLDGKKIYKPIRNKDELDDFLEKMENPDYWKTVHDKKTSSDIVLSDEQIELVNRLQRGQFGDVNFNEFEVSKLVHAIKMGWIKPRRVEDDSRGRFYDLWASESSSILAKHKMHLPAPKIPLPGHEESYNPPPDGLPVLLFAESSLGAAGPVRQEAAICSQKVSQSPSGVSRSQRSGSFHQCFSIRTVACFRDSAVLILSPALADKQVLLSSERLLTTHQEEGPSEESQTVVWSETDGEELNQGIRLKIQHPKAVHQVTWHSKGDYLASVMPDHSSHLQVFIHQLSRRRSQNPFRRNKGLVQAVSFHPIRPYFFVATQRSVRIYNLVKQEMTKKLQANSKWISSIAVHSGGDHVICGSYDCRLSWFDLDLSTKPYKMLRYIITCTCNTAQ
ncbi:hypothetical protein GOODEAATRI_014373 [Goodea atripinnis]|uniref:BOP1 N-terminal domain-containing protein n=1 Tax=Goodea atripinnis TaxID=208336 RepID=A0ABV0MHR6_9TELE